jgi:hypothetical protein
VNQFNTKGNIRLSSEKGSWTYHYLALCVCLPEAPFIIVFLTSLDPQSKPYSSHLVNKFNIKENIRLSSEKKRILNYHYLALCVRVSDDDAVGEEECRVGKVTVCV